MKTFHQYTGFTLVEMIVSLGLFSVAVTISVGALLALIASNEQLQEEQIVLTNLSFALDSMTRELRTGTHYYCEVHPDSNGNTNIFNDGNNMDTQLGTQTQDCANGNTNPSTNKVQGVSFIESGDSISGARSRVVYFYDQNQKKLFRRVSSGDALSLVSSDIDIREAEFFLTGSTPDTAPGGDLIQPTITIYMVAAESSDPLAKTYTVETTITQRTLDI
ncbi:MAG: type II secretion system protein [Patescibacteria group bacterium]